MTDDGIESLEERLRGLQGHSRARLLLELGQVRANRYWRKGPGTADALEELNAAIEALNEAYKYFEKGDPLRGQVASQLGWLFGTRHTAHAGKEEDRETGITLLEEAIGFPQLPPVMQAVARIILAQLYLSRVAGGLKSPDLMRKAMLAGTPPAGGGDADRAADHLRQVLQGPQVSEQITAFAETMLTVAQAMQTMMGGFGQGAGGFDLGRMMQAVGALQKLQQEQAGGWKMGAGSLPPMPSLFDADKVAAMDPLDRPVASVDGPEPEPPPLRDIRPSGVPSIDADALRQQLLTTVADGKDLFGTVDSLLAPNATLPETKIIDDIVALAASITSAENPSGIDHFLLAVALYLRSHLDQGGGWGDEESGSDIHAAAESLLMAIRELPVEQADVLPVVYRLAAVLDERLPADRVRARLAERLDDVTAALRQTGADALAYPQQGGVLLLNGSSGRLESVAADEPLPPRMLVVGEEVLPLNGSVVSSVASGSQLVALARRTRLRITENPVFLANPRGDRDQATFDALLLRRAFYPRSIGLGRMVEDIHGAGTPDDVLAHLGASMLHLGCGITASGALELAGPAELSPQAIAACGGEDRVAGGVAILPPLREGFPGLADALLTAGFTSVIGWLEPVPEPTAALMIFLLHGQLVDEGLPPAEAVAAVQQWMRDPHREAPPYLPMNYAATFQHSDRDDQHGRAMVHRGI